MNTYILPLTISTISSLATLLGYLPIFINKKYQNKLIPLSLALSAGIMLTVSLISLIPESINYLNENNIILIILYTLIHINIGIIIVNILDKKIDKNNNLYKLGIISTIALILHNIPEGITTYLTTNINQDLGIKLSIAIALHNIPEGISIAIPIYYSTNDKKKAFFITLIAGSSELFGTILAHIFLKNIISNTILSIVLSITAGIMINLSFKELIPKSLDYQNKKTTIIGILLGIIIMIICNILL